MAIESHFRLRIPLDLKAKIEEAARASGRSINAQVLHSIEMALGQGDEIADMRSSLSEAESRLDELERRMDRTVKNVDIIAERVGIIDG